MPRVLMIAMTVLIAAMSVGRMWAAPPAKGFQGYWVGIDPVDGGDQRRSFELRDDGIIAVVGRDSFLRLCDNTDRGLITIDDGVFVRRDTVTTDNLRLTCFGNSTVVVLKARYELVNDSLMIEHLTTLDDAPVQRLLLHRISN